MRTNFDLLKLAITCEGSQVSRWDMASSPVTGREHLYHVTLRPEWADLLHRVVAFIPAENGAHGGKVYGKIFPHDPHGWRTKIGTRRGERDAVPEWMAPLHCLRLLPAGECPRRPESDFLSE
jgi:hypothetical protein